MRYQDATDVNRYGFRWEQVDVTRLTELYGRKVVGVYIDHHDIQITVSPQGRNVQVHVDGKMVWPA